MKLRIAIRRFETQLEADGKSAHTIGAYLRDVRAFRSWLGDDAGIAGISPAAIARFFASDAMRTKEAVSLNRMKTSVRIFFRYLAESGYLKRDPSRLIKASRCERKVPVALSERESRKLLSTIQKSGNACARRDYVMIAILLGTGIRLGSLVRLNIGNIDFARSVIRVNSKGNTEETIYLQTHLRKLLRSYIKSNELTDGDPVFQNGRGQRLGARRIQQRIKFWLGEARINNGASVHTLRHTFATRLYEKTRDLYLVQKALGHRQITTTEIYTRVSDSSLRRAVNLL